MDDLHRRILAEKENVEIALCNLKDAMARKEKTVIELAAIATFFITFTMGSRTFEAGSESKRYRHSRICYMA
ncbi:Uncharacterised protein [uncultured archaeon]|nr:Uncharacterised protein [uncultured archaeon]